MPKSKVRKKAVHPAPSDRRTPQQALQNVPRKAPQKAKVLGPSHPLYVGVMLGLMLLGLAWMVVYYLAQNKIPLINDLGPWNFAVGFALMISGLLMTMRWR